MSWLPSGGRGRKDPPQLTPPLAPASVETQPAAKPEQSAADINAGLVKLTQRAPAQASLGETYASQIVVAANEDAANVIVSGSVPAGAAYVKSEPTAEVSGSTLTWRFPSLRKGEAKNIQVWFNPEKEGELTSCCTVTATPIQCVSTMVGKPALHIAKSGPETALLGSTVTYGVLVWNSGNSVAKDVVVTDAVPEGFSHESGQKAVTFSVGDLAPGQSKSNTVSFKADRRGRICNVAVANSVNAGKVQDDACTVIVQPGLNLVKTGDKMQFLNKVAAYSIVVSNTGDTTLNGVVVTDNAPAQNTVVAAPGATLSGNTATWSIGDLASHESRTFRVQLSSKQAGTFCNVASVKSTQNLTASSEACTEWRGMPALLIEAVDDPDPIQVGETTTYTIRVTNQGTADDTNVGISAVFPKEITPVTAEGGTITGQTVKFAPVARLGAKQSFTYKITGRGAVAGDNRLKVEMTSDLLKTPVTEEESTHVY